MRLDQVRPRAGAIMSIERIPESMPSEIMQAEFARLREAAFRAPLTRARGLGDAHMADLPGGLKMALSVNK